jgi:hypothetical protein
MSETKHYQELYDRMYGSAKKCRRDAMVLETRAEIYEECADRLMMAIENTIHGHSQAWQLKDDTEPEKTT